MSKCQWLPGNILSTSHGLRVTFKLSWEYELILTDKQLLWHLIDEYIFFFLQERPEVRISSVLEHKHPKAEGLSLHSVCHNTTIIHYSFIHTHLFTVHVHLLIMWITMIAVHKVLCGLSQTPNSGGRSIIIKLDFYIFRQWVGRSASISHVLVHVSIFGSGFSFVFLGSSVNKPIGVSHF